MSTQFAWRLPSLGFGILVASYGLLAAFLAWGFSTPELDRAWHIIERMAEPDAVALAPSELRTLSAVLRRHPGLAGALAERSPVGFIEPSPGGCTSRPVSHLLVQPKAPDSLRIQVACRGDSSAFPVALSLRGEGIDRTLRLDGPAPLHVVLPSGQPPAPALVTVTTAAAANAPRSSVQVCIEGQALASAEASP